MGRGGCNCCGDWMTTAKVSKSTGAHVWLNNFGLDTHAVGFTGSGIYPFCRHSFDISRGEYLPNMNSSVQRTELVGTLNSTSVEGGYTTKSFPYIKKLDNNGKYVSELTFDRSQINDFDTGYYEQNEEASVLNNPNIVTQSNSSGTFIYIKNGITGYGENQEESKYTTAYRDFDDRNQNSLTFEPGFNVRNYLKQKYVIPRSHYDYNYLWNNDASDIYFRPSSKIQEQGRNLVHLDDQRLIDYTGNSAYASSKVSLSINRTIFSEDRISATINFGCELDESHAALSGLYSAFFGYATADNLSYIDSQLTFRLDNNFIADVDNSNSTLTYTGNYTNDLFQNLSIDSVSLSENVSSVEISFANNPSFGFSINVFDAILDSISVTQRNIYSVTSSTPSGDRLDAYFTVAGNTDFQSNSAAYYIRNSSENTGILVDPLYEDEEKKIGFFRTFDANTGDFAGFFTLAALVENSNLFSDISNNYGLLEGTLTSFTTNYNWTPAERAAFILMSEPNRILYAASIAGVTNNEPVNIRINIDDSVDSNLYKKTFVHKVGRDDDYYVVANVRSYVYTNYYSISYDSFVSHISVVANAASTTDTLDSYGVFEFETTASVLYRDIGADVKEHITDNNFFSNPLPYFGWNWPYSYGYYDNYNFYNSMESSYKKIDKKGSNVFFLLDDEVNGKLFSIDRLLFSQHESSGLFIQHTNNVYDRSIYFIDAPFSYLSSSYTVDGGLQYQPISSTGGTIQSCSSNIFNDVNSYLSRFRKNFLIKDLNQAGYSGYETRFGNDMEVDDTSVYIGGACTSNRIRSYCGRVMTPTSPNLSIFPSVYDITIGPAEATQLYEEAYADWISSLSSYSWFKQNYCVFLIPEFSESDLTNDGPVDFYVGDSAFQIRPYSTVDQIYSDLSFGGLNTTVYGSCLASGIICISFDDINEISSVVQSYKTGDSVPSYLFEYFGYNNYYDYGTTFAGNRYGDWGGFRYRFYDQPTATSGDMGSKSLYFTNNTIDFTMNSFLPLEVHDGLLNQYILDNNIDTSIVSLPIAQSMFFTDGRSDLWFGIPLLDSFIIPTLSGTTFENLYSHEYIANSLKFPETFDTSLLASYGIGNEFNVNNGLFFKVENSTTDIKADSFNLRKFDYSGTQDWSKLYGYDSFIEDILGDDEEVIGTIQKPPMTNGAIRDVCLHDDDLYITGNMINLDSVRPGAYKTYSEYLNETLFKKFPAGHTLDTNPQPASYREKIIVNKDAPRLLPSGSI